MPTFCMKVFAFILAATICESVGDVLMRMGLHSHQLLGRVAMICGATALLGTPGAGWAKAANLREAPKDGLKRADPREVGVDPEGVLAFLDAAKAEGLELNSFMLFRQGAVAAEGYFWPYRPDVYHMLHSATKSFVGAGIGIAVDEGLLKLDDPVLKFFPDRIAQPSANLQAMTVDSLLTQTSGHAIGISGSQWRPIKTSWVTEFLKVPVAFAPGTHFAYSSATSFMLSAIVTQITGKTLDEYMRPRLFDPMEIRNYHWDVGPENINPGGNGLSTTTADFTKLGVMLMNGGKWNGRQIVSNSWATELGKPKHGNPYGYQWWILPNGLGFAAAGKFGQFTFVFPQLQAVLTYMSGVADDATTRDKMNALALKHIGKMCAGAASSTGDAALRARVGSLRVLPKLTPTNSPLAKRVSGKNYRCEDNADGVRSIRLGLTGGIASFEMTDDRGTHTVTNGLSDWKEGITTITGGYLHHEYEPGRMRVVAGGRWISENQFEMTWQFIESGFRDTATLTFEGDAVRYDRSVNVNSGPLKRPTIMAGLA